MNNINRAGIPKHAIHLASFSLLEAEAESKAFEPSWYNVWEAYLYKKACRQQRISQWYFKRFGVDESILHGEAIRKTHYREWLNILEKSGKVALEKLDQHEAFTLKTARNALLYVDSWGEITALEEAGSWRDAFSIDILPKSLVKLYGARDYTCKIRGERSSLLNAFVLAEQLLNSDTVDNVIVCGQFRAFPVLVFSEIDKPVAYLRFSLLSNFTQRLKKYVLKSSRFLGLSTEPQTLQPNCRVSVERVGCFIFKKHHHSNQRTAKGIHALDSMNLNPMPLNPRGYCASHRTITYPYFDLKNNRVFHAKRGILPIERFRTPLNQLVQVIQQKIQKNTQSILFSSPPMLGLQEQITMIIKRLQHEANCTEICHSQQTVENTHNLSNVYEPHECTVSESMDNQIMMDNINYYYGDSGCLNPALCWMFLTEKNLTQGHHIFVHLDAYRGIWFTETWY